MATLRPKNLGASKSAPMSSSPNPSSLSPSPTSGHTSPGSPSTSATSAAPPPLPSDEQVEAVIKQATSTQSRSDGRPPPGKDTRTQLFTGNLPYRVRWQDLKDLFRRAGTVLRADVSLTPDNRSRGYGTVLLASAEDAGRAVDMFNGYNWQGRVLEVRLDRLGAVHGLDAEANAAGVVPRIGIPPLTMGTVNDLSPNIGAHNGLHVPSPHPAGPFISQQLSGNGASPSLLSATALLAAASHNSTINTINPGLITLQQPQQAQQVKEREELLINQGTSGRPDVGGLDPFLGTLGRGGLGTDLDRDQSRSSSGMRCLFVGNLPFHCQWQDLKDLFRQAGTILRADVSLGPDCRSRGFGTVTFANEIDAERAVAMFNGFDYSGRALNVHYDKYSTPSPLSCNLSPHPSTLATPVQPTTSSTQATLLQAAQLQQLVGGHTTDRYTNLSSLSTTGQSSNNVNGDGFPTQAQMLVANLQALHKSFPVQSQSRPTTSSGIGTDQPRTRVSSTGSESSVSPFNIHVPGTSPSLAERRQKIPPPIGTVSASTSRRGSNSGLSAGANAEGRGVTTTLSRGSSVSQVLDTSPASPTKGKRLTSQSLPVSSASAPLAASGVSSLPDSQRLSTSSVVQKSQDPISTSVSSSSSVAESSILDRPGQSSSANSTSPRSSHPAHPGPISLPPPIPVSSFPPYSPHHHPMSPPGHPVSPPVYASYPLYGPMSPMHPYPVAAHTHPSNITPHGLPPITPSMPSFSFVPQPSPGVLGGGSSAIPPTPAEVGTAPPTEGYPPPGQPIDSAGNPITTGMGMAPMSPPMHLPHHVFQPFTPGTVMSPGAFYGRPNGGPPRGSYLNPAVGSPVMVHPPYGFPSHPGSQPGSPYYFQNPNGGPYGEEPSGYFPPVGPCAQPRHEGYFPPVSALGSSGLANEILRDGNSMNTGEGNSSERLAHERNNSATGSAPNSENGPSEDTDAERARSSSSGATSWRSDENAGGAGDATAVPRTESSLKGLAQDMASVRLGPSSTNRNAKYAEAVKSNIQRTESVSPVEDKINSVSVARHSSFGEETSPGHPASRRTHSAETGAQVRLGA
ncbi:hypothetical protein ACEPAF_1381 [Sanghuangporus sanghuang]